MVNQQVPVVIIGAGPAGLMASEVLAQAGYAVQVYEQMPSAARKFLMAGKTGLNISHSEEIELFISRYDQADWLRPMIRAFDAEAIQHWMAGLGISSYVGSSGRIFPLEMKAAPLLRAWLARLKQHGVQFFYRHQWLGWAENGQLQFKHAGLVSEKPASAVVLATGGGSWRRLGSDAAWVQVLQQHGVQVQPLQASNVGVKVAWSVFMQTLGGQPLKRVKAWVNPQQAWQGEAVISHYGLEGGLIYKLSRDLRQQLNSGQPAMFYLDLLPDMSLAQLQQKLQAGGKQSLTNIWRKAGLDTVKSALLREYLPKAEWTDSTKVAALAKALPVSIQGLQPVDEAISTAGGVGLSGIDTNLMLKVKPGVFCCGEMLDWDAPTGGYLLTACLATGRQAGLGVGAWLQANTSDECLYE
jgi:uncharacterized flavoprotein (TIGR03862 family)